MTARKRCFEQAFRALRRGGTLVLVALPADNYMQLPIFETVLYGINVVGSIVGTRLDLAEVFELHVEGKTQVIYEKRKGYAMRPEKTLPFYLPDTYNGRTACTYDGIMEGIERAEADFPSLVVRDQQQVTQLAEQTFLQWFGRMQNPPTYASEEKNYQNRWDANAHEGRRLFITGFLHGYEDAIVRLDAAKAKTAPPPQAAVIPETPATMVVDRARFTVKRIEQDARECVYYLEISHPGVTDGPQELLLAYPVSGARTFSQQISGEPRFYIKKPSGQ